MPRKKEPTALKIAKGNPGKKKLNELEPMPDIGLPEMPDHLTADAKKEWKRIGEQLYKLGILSVIDGTILAAYCQAFAEWRKASKELNKKGSDYVVSDPVNGQMKKNPWVLISDSAQDRMFKYLRELGLSPASRPNINIDKDQRNKADPVKAHHERIALIKGGKKVS